MIKKLICIAIIMLVVKTKAQQNLVPNPGFEIYDTCPNTYGQIHFAKGWFTPNTATPDYFNACASPSTGVSVPSNAFGSSFAHSGNAMMGIYYFDIYIDPLYREYLAIRLKNALQTNQRYFLSYFIRLPDSTHYATNRQFAYVGDSINKLAYDTINVVPNVSTYLSSFYTNKTNWIKIKGSFTALGGEKFLYLGRFNHPFTNDTLYTGGATTSLNSYRNAYYYIDNICLTQDSMFNESWLGVGLEELSKESDVLAYPFLVSDFLFLNETVTYKELKVYNCYGQSQNVWVQNNAIDFSRMPMGIYFITIIFEDNKAKTLKIIKT